MKKFLLLSLPVMVMCAVSCEKPEGNNNETNPPEEEIVQGTIEAIATYNGSLPTSVSTYYICDINQLDIIATLSQQMHEANMNGNVEHADDIYNILGNNVLSECIYYSWRDEEEEDPWFSYDIDPGTYIVVAERRVYYDYSNVDFSIGGSVTFKLQYKEVQVESGQVISVAFTFEDYIVY